jgi:hypothetical protein
MKARAGIGISIVIAFLAALTIASSPQLHERLHKVDSHHECAATMIASGNCEHSAPPQLAPKLENAPNSPAFLPKRFQFVVASVPSSVQEHAPPKQSRRFLAPAFLLRRNPPEARCIHPTSIMKTFNETNFSNHNRDAERSEHGDGAGCDSVTQPFRLAKRIAWNRDRRKRCRYQSGTRYFT